MLPGDTSNRWTRSGKAPVMVSPTAGQRAHSARVEIELILDRPAASRVVHIAQVGRDFLVPAAPVTTEPGRAELRLRVDGRERRRAIRLPDGLRPGTEARILPAN